MNDKKLFYIEFTYSNDVEMRSQACNVYARDIYEVINSKDWHRGEPIDVIKIEEVSYSVEHELKVWPEYFEATVKGVKPFELRKNDRGYKVGDHVLLKEYNPVDGYTGRQITRRIEYVLKGVPWFGLQADYCILGLSRQ